MTIALALLAAASPCLAQSQGDLVLRPSVAEAPAGSLMADARVQLGGLCGGASSAPPGLALETRSTVVGSGGSLVGPQVAGAAAAQLSAPLVWRFRTPSGVAGEVATGPALFASAFRPGSVQPGLMACSALQAPVSGPLSAGLVAQSHGLGLGAMPGAGGRPFGLGGAWRPGVTIIPHARLRF